jgi:hypothetical protein
MRRSIAAAAGLACLLGASLALAQNPSGPKHRRTAPQQYTPAASNSQSQEETVLAYIPPYDFVRDTPTALAALMHPLAPAPGRNDLVEACRAMVETSAESHGAARVEAASAGPQRRVRDGHMAPVQFRILYPGFLRSQVRQARLNCKANREGKVLDAQP